MTLFTGPQKKKKKKEKRKKRKKTNGIYSVKLGYKMLCEEVRREEASGSIKSGGSGLWKGIWKLKVSDKLKHFLWKALIGQKCIDPLW